MAKFGGMHIRVNFQGAPEITMNYFPDVFFEQCMSFFEQKLSGKVVKTTQKGVQRCQQQLVTHLGIFELLCILSSGH